MKLSSTALALSILAPGALAKGGCPNFKGVSLWEPNTSFRAASEENANSVGSAIEGGNRVEIEEAIEAAVGTVADGDHCTTNSVCKSFIEANGGNRADPGEEPPRTMPCCVAYPQGSTPGSYSMSFCWNPSTCNGLGQVQCIEEISLEIPVAVPMSAEVPDAEIAFLQNLDGACADVTTPEECAEILAADMTNTSSGSTRGAAVAFGAALLAGVGVFMN